ncbi:hypothetical protein GCM10009678_69290 [Actinomadura kijaniata]|uniref:DUF4132 domain-containing protein n=1 Tax=Actinomadura namibiensis TaxID=182080 RepID=A0A7W3QMS8_ACTNM|nr:DUF4132 domain-containing protein [Actinomadura namibiensis]MBA8952333.1 hypothetical protein [Actinomadura namibiensis]
MTPDQIRVALRTGDHHAHPAVDLTALSATDLGDLLPDAYTSASTGLRFLIEDEAQARPADFTPRACLRLFDALVTDLDRRDWADLGLGLAALLRCTGPWPDGLAERADTLARFMNAKGEDRHVHDQLAVAALAGPDRHRETAERLVSGRGPSAERELDLMSRWPLVDRVRFAVLHGVAERRRAMVPPDTEERLRSRPGYLGFLYAELREAERRLADIQSGRTPYKADAAFTPHEVEALERALRAALANDEPWLPDYLARVLPATAVAPTAARTLPSQAFLYAVARAGQDHPTPELVTALRHVKTVVRHAGVPKQLDKMLKRIEAALAERTDVALRVPDPGPLRRRVGDHEAEITVTDTATLVWHRDGKPLRGVPAAVRADHRTVLKDLRDRTKRINTQLATLARALEGGYTADPAHTYARWRSALLDHPLAGAVAGRLIWEIDGRAVLPALQDVPDAAPDAPVRLWHPIGHAPEEIRAWRDLITERELRQPFKQAFREIYLLTPAEEETAAHSHRFAAHLVHYRRLFALFRARGWRSDLLGPWDGGDEDEATRVLAAGEWRVAFRHVYADPAGERELASTDRVRFSRREGGAWREAPLREVPPVVFSEAMRDVDLFVAVTSIAADPDWTGQGPGRAYWERDGFGALTATAETRRAALERVLPRLRIAGRCELTDRFLKVRGDLRTYRIHLGSANILMEPDDSYLCIVPGRSDPRVFLPFEDDRLSLILSKAALLAADTTITDPTILAQIRRGER